MSQAGLLGSRMALLGGVTIRQPDQGPMAVHHGPDHRGGAGRGSLMNDSVLAAELPVIGVRAFDARRVGGGRAVALPPSARSNGSCGFPASRFPVWSSPLTGDDDPPASPGGLRGSSMPAQGLSLFELVRPSAMYSPAPRASTLPHRTGPSPSP